MKTLFACLLVISLSACSGESEDGGTVSGEHVWKSQTDSLDKARAVEGMLQQDAADKSRMIDEPGQ
ncbi:MAG: hypothetical protein RIB78_01310 [Gammaproteobacteria bacterium]